MSFFFSFDARLSPDTENGILDLGNLLTNVNLREFDFNTGEQKNPEVTLRSVGSMEANNFFLSEPGSIRQNSYGVYMQSGGTTCSGTC